MLNKKHLKADLAALALLGLSVYLALALLSYDPADPLLGSQTLRTFGVRWDQLVYPPNESATNLAGSMGAVVAHLLLTTLGVGAYLAWATLILLDARLLKRQPVSEPIVRAAGWLITLVALTTLIASFGPRVSPGPVVGAGGYMGALGATVLDNFFTPIGVFWLAFCVLLAGVIMWTDYIVFQATWQYALQPIYAAVLNRNSSGKRISRQPKRRDDLSDDSSIRLAGKSAIKKQAAAAAVAVQVVEDEVEEEEEELEEDRPLKIRKPPTKSERQAVMEQLDAAVHQDDEEFPYELPPLDLLLEGEDVAFEEQERDVRAKAKVLEETFASFGYNVKVVEIDTGPVIAQFEVELEAGLRLAKITNLADDLAIALRVPSVRIVAPIPGKNTVGIEVPNAQRQLVRMREVMEEANPKTKKMAIPIYLGKDVSGVPLVFDLTTLPHLLIAGRTGTGKSVCLNSIILSMVMTRRPDEVKMLMIDPKMVELSPYKRLPHLMHPVVTDMKKAEAILGWAVDKMEERYALLARAGVRHVSIFNQLGDEELRKRIEPESDEEWAEVPKHLPFIVIVADEMADLMMTAGKEVEQHIIRLAQKSRAVGIHLVLATQKPTVDVITGLIKSNLPARIAFQVASRTDSRVVLDEMGADKLLGNGDMLFLWPGTSTLLRGQGTYVSDEEITGILDFVGTTEPQYVHELVALKPKDAGDGPAGIQKNRDDLYEAAIDIVVREGRGSVSLLQRSLGIGYGRAARLIDYMAEDGIVGEYNGAQAREVLYTPEQWASLQGEAEAPAPVPTPSRKKAAISVVQPVEEDEVEDEEVDEADTAEEEKEELWEEEDPNYDDGEFDETSPIRPLTKPLPPRRKPSKS